jgi:hypothetical protein
MEGLKQDLERHQADIEALIEHAKENELINSEILQEREELENHLQTTMEERNAFQEESATKDTIVQEMSDMVEQLQQQVHDELKKV